MAESYQIAEKDQKELLKELLVEHEEVLGPMVRLIEEAGVYLQSFIEVLGQAGIEAALQISAQQVAGARQQGKKRDSNVSWHGSQPGSVRLSDVKIRVQRPRLRRNGTTKSEEVEIPAYEAMNDSRLASRLLEVILRGVSTRNYEEVAPQMANAMGLSKSSVSRDIVEATTAQLEELCARRFDEKEFLIIYVDGVRMGEYVVVVALGVDREGQKHILGLREGATENKTVVTTLLEDLVQRGVNQDSPRLFVIDGAKALRNAITRVFGKENPVQRCRRHKVQNVMDHLPQERKDFAKATMNAAYKLDAEGGIAKLKNLAELLEKEHPSAATSLREGLEETFTVNRLGLPGSLRRCLSTTNIIENPNSGLRSRTGRVSRWRDGQMVVRWVASALLAAEKNFNRIMGYRDLWMLEAHLKGEDIGKKGGAA